MSEKNIKLVIAEKPSVAQSIAKVIGADKRENGSSGLYMIRRNAKSHSSAYGFLLWKTRRFRMAFLI